MIRMEECKIFTNCMSELKELSRDSSKSEPDCYMTESAFMAINFDKVKTRYLNDLKLSEESASSVDGILQNDNEIIFVEFKNGKMKNEKSKVRDKIRDSLLIFCDITQSTISDIRKFGTFILVFNEEKNPISQQGKGEINPQETAPSLVKIAEHFSDKAKEEFIRFGFEKYKKFCFKEVHTYSKERFETYIKECL